MTHNNPAVQEIMDKYTPIQVKRLLHSHDNKDFVHHQLFKDILKFYADHDMYIHHWLLDDVFAYDFYANLQQGYNSTQVECENEEQRFELQKYYISTRTYYRSIRKYSRSTRKYFGRTRKYYRSTRKYY